VGDPTELQVQGFASAVKRSDGSIDTKASVASVPTLVAAGVTDIRFMVTSAAIAGFTRFDKITLDEWNRYLAVNLTGTFLCARAALSDMVAAQWAES
jgi:2-hydroxycyclohexanecarboxyl-CoA dehydrogenase